MGVYVEEEIVNVLHRESKIVETKFVGQNSSLIEVVLHDLATDRHYDSPLDAL
jgi:hypothetical protein